MPEAVDPLASVGFLIAAAGVTIAGLGGYAIALARRLASSRARNRQLRSGAQDGG